MNLLSAILRSTWMIDEQYAIGLSPFLQNLLEGKSVDFSQHAVKSKVSHVDYSTSNTPEKGVIAVIPVKGVIMKEDFCGDMGMRTLNALIKQYSDDPKITAVIMEFDTPGGQADYMPVIAKTLREAREKKPFIGFVEGGMSASAGYYLMSQCSYCFVSAKTDMVGSIGTMIQFASYGPKAKESIVIHTINATKSTDKNKAFMDAEKGDYALMRTSLLDPLNEEFHANVKVGRPDISSEVFTGKIYLADQAVDLGMIDGVKTFQEVIEFTQEQIANHTTMSLFNKQPKMKNEKLSAILGRDVNAGGKLSGEDMSTISAHIVLLEDANSTATADLETAQTTITGLQAQVEGLEAAAQTHATELAGISALEQRLAVLESKPGAGAAADAIVPVEGAEATDYSEEPWLNPDSPINKAAAEGLLN